MTEPSRPPRMSGWSLRRRLGGALLIAVVIILGVVAASAVLLVETRHQQSVVTRNYYDAGRFSSDFFLRISDAEGAVRDFSLTRDEADLAPLTADERIWRPGATAHIQDLLGVAPRAAGRLRTVEASALRWHREYALPAVAEIRRNGGLRDDTIQEGRALFDEVRSGYTAYLVDLREGRAEARDRLTRLSGLLFAAVVVSGVVSIAVAALLWGLLRAWVSTPVANLAAETRIVGRGRLEHEVTVDGPPEFVRLAEDIEAMRRRLVAQIAAVEAAGREVAEARGRLEEQAAELQRSNRELEQFAYVASHDLQEPLRKVASFCQLLQKRYAGQLDERADQYIEFAVDGAKRMQRLINDLLDFSRVGRMTSGLSQVDLGQCLDAALANLEVAVGETGAEIEAGPMPTVRGEAPLLTQLFQNLIGNAIKFRSEDRPPHIRLTAQRKDDVWEFACADNGIGIAPEYAERVFVIFQRLHPKDLYGGTGIGLAMCKKIIEYHGGRIWVDADATDGAVVRWTLPATTGPDGVPDPGAGDEGTPAVVERHPVPVRMGP